MLIIFKLIFATTLNFAFSREYKVFEKTIPSKNIFPICNHIKGDENGIFTLLYKTKNLNHTFYIMRGIPADTCFDHVKQINKFKKISRLVTISGDNGYQDQEKKNEMIWTLKYIKTDTECDSHLTNYCYPDNQPDKMY